MKIRTTFIGAALCAMVAACSSAPDTTERAEAIQKKADEIGKVVTPLYIQIEPFNGVPEVDVMTCPTLHQGDIPISQMCHGTGDLEEVLLVVRNSAGKVVNVIVEDRPGGGCIHVQIPGLQTGSTVSALAVVKDVPGGTPYSVGRISEVVPAF
jgi:hypothetical protein